MSKEDLVNQPKHYKQFDKECFEMMIEIWGEEAFILHCQMCAFKYKIRAGKKGNPLTDLEKADWYLNKANELRAKKKRPNNDGGNPGEFCWSSNFR